MPRQPAFASIGRSGSRSIAAVFGVVRLARRHLLVTGADVDDLCAGIASLALRGRLV
jgi:hypothetical protein